MDLRQVASRVVADILQLQEEDILDVSTWEHTMPLAKEIVKEARRAGADTVLSVEADDIWFDALKNLPESWLREPSLIKQSVRRTATASVYITGPANPEEMKDVSGDRWRANSAGADATYEPFEDDPIPSVTITLGAVTQARARNYGFAYEKWYNSVLAAMSVDPESLRDRGKALAKYLTGASEARLQAPGGTEFTFQLHGAEPVTFTGEVRPVKGNKATYFSSLPSGSLSIALKQGSGEGRIASTRDIPQAGDFIRGLAWEFTDGRVERVEAKENLSLFARLWEDKKERGADQLGYLTIGLNPSMIFGFLEDEYVEGAVTIAIGENEWLGGSNECDYIFPISFDTATLSIDDRVVVEKGRISG